MTCDVWAGKLDGSGVCDWCRLPVDVHGLLPCGRCGGSRVLPDPTDRARGPWWTKRVLACGCSGWLANERRKAA